MVCIDDEIPFETPNGWEWCRLNSLADIVRGGSPRPAGSPEYYNGNIPFLKVADLTKDNQMYVSSYTATIKEAGLKKTRKVSANTLLLTNSGATLGVPKVCTFETTFNDGIAAFLYLTEELKPYLYWFLCAMTDIFRNINQGTAQPNLNTDIIKNTLFAIPPIGEQRRIIKRIEELFPIIDKYSLAQSNLSQLNADINANIKKSILHEAIQGRLVSQDASEEPASSLLQRIREEKQILVKEGKLKKKDVIESTIYRGDDNKYFEKCGKDLFCIDDEIPFEIPNSWEWVRFGSLINMRMGKTPARGDVNYWTNGKTPWVSISDMFDYGIIKNTKEKVSDFAIQTAFGGNIVPKGTLIMSFKLTVGRTSLLDIDAVHNEAIISIRPYVDKEDSLRDYLFYVLPLISNFGDSKDAIKGKTLNSTSLFNLLIPLPPLAEQKRIVTAIVTAWQVL